MYVSMDRRELEMYVEDKYEMLRSLNIYERNIDIKMTKNFVLSLTGPRRAGKTYNLYNIIKANNYEKSLYLNFEDIELVDTNPKDILNIVKNYVEIFGNEPDYILLDEVQNVLGWEKVVRELHESKKYHIVVTGSSSKLLSREISTSLRGRSLTHFIMPLSFTEYLKFKDFHIPSHLSSTLVSKIKNHLSRYFMGSFPDVALEESLAPRFYEDFVNLVIFKDIMERYSIRNSWLIKFMFKSMISSTSKEFSIHKLYNTLKSRGVDVAKRTLYQYSEYFNDAFIFFFVKKYYPSLRKRELSIPKIYPVDPGIAHHFGIRDRGRLLENVVFLELIRRSGYENVFYWKNGGEVDFIVVKNDKPVEGIQVTFELNDENRSREVKPLISFSKATSCKKLKIITWDQRNDLVVNNTKISVVPLWEWIMTNH